MGTESDPIPNIVAGTEPVRDDADPRLVHSVIADAWGLYFAQGGVVMAAALRAMAAVLDRPDLSLASASAAFCLPVACGPVTTTVDVLRSGRRGAQVRGLLHDATAPRETANVAVTAVFTDPALAGPALAPLPRPAELTVPPPVAERVSTPLGANRFPLGFLDNTEWQVASTAEAAVDVSGAAGVPRMALWFRFTDPPAGDGEAWEPALLPIPGDALGSALVAALGDGERPVGSVSLQIDVQVLAPVRGTWIGIETTCTHVGSGLANGVLHLWTEDGVHAATVTQTAMLRSLDG